MKGLVVGAKNLLGEDFVAPKDDKEHLLFSRESTNALRLRLAGLPMLSSRGSDTV
jgi:hypothetical protein